MHRDKPTTVTVTTVTMIRAYEPLGTETEAQTWMSRLESDEVAQELLDEALTTLDRVLAAEASASGRPYAQAPALEQILTAKIGFGDGDHVSEGRFTDAMDIDARGGTAGSKRERVSRTRPLARIAAIIGGKDTARACEFLVPRIRADLDAGRVLTAALTIENAMRATVVEMDPMLDDPDHERDLDRLETMLPDLTTMTDSLLTEARPWAGLAESLEEPLSIAERIIRRHRVLTQ
ncbi:MAG: hypothetical protein WBP55_08980 [Solirubrobacterales bacterium]